MLDCTYRLDVTMQLGWPWYILSSGAEADGAYARCTVCTVYRVLCTVVMDSRGPSLMYAKSIEKD